LGWDIRILGKSPQRCLDKIGAGQSVAQLKYSWCALYPGLLPLVLCSVQHQVAFHCYDYVSSACCAALDEAQDISLYLKPFKQMLDQIELVEFQYMGQHLPSLMHVVCLTWSHSSYYCKPGRVAVLLQEMCNFLIEKVSCSCLVV